MIIVVSFYLIKRLSALRRLCACSSASLMRDVLLIIITKMNLLGLSQNSLEIGLKLIQVVLCPGPIKMLADNPLQAARPFPILVVADRVEYF